jgi:hypothetical protein
VGSSISLHRIGLHGLLLGIALLLFYSLQEDWWVEKGRPTKDDNNFDAWRNRTKVKRRRRTRREVMRGKRITIVAKSEQSVGTSTLKWKLASATREQTRGPLAVSPTLADSRIDHLLTQYLWLYHLYYRSADDRTIFHNLIAFASVMLVQRITAAMLWSNSLTYFLFPLTSCLLSMKTGLKDHVDCCIQLSAIIYSFVTCAHILFRNKEVTE